MGRYLVTGAAGFIGAFVAKALATEGHDVVGLDNLNDYYDPRLKHERLEFLSKFPTFKFVKMDLADREGVAKLFAEEKFDKVVNLAAQAGVRYSIENPGTYIDSNLVGFANILEGCRHNKVKHLVYASSSSVYGANKDMPFSVEHNVDHPVSLYAATKKANELMAHSYSHMFGMAVTGLRFFTVYGPWGRPDMALFKFTKAILADEPIDVYNNGDMLRDFTYVDDIVKGVLGTLANVPEKGASSSGAAYKIYNIGNNQPVQLMKMIEIIEETLGKKAKKNFMPMQPGDVKETYADVSALERDVGFKPNTPLSEGIANFVAWYKEFYK